MNSEITKQRQLAPDKKYGIWKTTSKKDKVDLLLKDDQKRILPAELRRIWLKAIGKQYNSAKKRQAKEARIAAQPKINIAQAAEMTLDDLVRGIKEGWIVV